MKNARRASSKSAARSRTAARSSPGIPGHFEVISSAKLSNCASASSTVPIFSRVVGLSASIDAPRMMSPAIKGFAMKSVRRNVAAIAACIASVAATSEKLKPPEFNRLISAAINKFCGSGNLTLAFCGLASHAAIGSAMTSSIETSASAMRFTNDELAPFSRRRRTR